MAGNMTEGQLNFFISKFNSNYMDTVWAGFNIFKKRKDGKKLGVRWCVCAQHEDEVFRFFYGDTPHGKKEKGFCYICRPYNITYIERTPDQIEKWCENVCGGKEKFHQMLNTVDEATWEDKFALYK